MKGLLFLLYLVVIVSTSYIDYKIFKKVSNIRLHTTARQFGAYLLLGIMGAFGLIFIGSASFSLLFIGCRGGVNFLSFVDPMSVIYIPIFRNLGKTAFKVFEVFEFVFGLGLCIVAGYLILKFQKKVGKIVFLR